MMLVGTPPLPTLQVDSAIVSLCRVLYSMFETVEKFHSTRLKFWWHLNLADCSEIVGEHPWLFKHVSNHFVDFMLKVLTKAANLPNYKFPIYTV